MSALLAHYGGIDEFGLYLIPVVAALAALFWVDRRARSRRVDEEGDGREGIGPHVD